MTDRLFKRHSIVGIVSNVLIYPLEGHGPEAEMAGALLDARCIRTAQRGHLCAGHR